MENPARLLYFSSPEFYREKENLYLDLRRREGRVLPDEEVVNLPRVSKSSPYAREWKWRERSLRRFMRQLSESSIPKSSGSESSSLSILDLGCGNGWMANRLAENPNWDLWALDLNQEELEQGARLFGRENLHFAYADVVSRNAVPGPTGIPGTEFRDTFDVIVLAASVQYFPDLKNLLETLRKLLKTKGEIHILDSQFYQNEMERTAARQRTLEYYTKMGVPEMARFYFHHLWPEAENLGAKNLNDSLKNRFLQKAKWLAPFQWLRFQAFNLKSNF